MNKWLIVVLSTLLLSIVPLYPWAYGKDNQKDNQDDQGDAVVTEVTMFQIPMVEL